MIINFILSFALSLDLIVTLIDWAACEIFIELTDDHLLSANFPRAEVFCLPLIQGILISR